MPNARRTVTINRPIHDVFTFLTTPENDPRWRPQVKSIRADGAPAEGQTIHQVIAGPGGRGIPADIEITEYQTPTRYAFQVIAGPVRPKGRYELVATSDGATEVTFTLNAELSGFKKLLMTRPVQRSMDSEVAGLDTAKALLEEVRD